MMTASSWLSLAIICLLGAMSPGPSLAVVVQQAVNGGARQGVICALAHGAGIFLWAILMVSGLGALLLTHPAWFNGVRALGASFLLYLGCRALFTRSNGTTTNCLGDGVGGVAAGYDGFLVALSNPKIVVFFAALFSQFIQPNATLAAQLTIATTAAVIDAIWYVLVALTVSSDAITKRLKLNSGLLDRVFGAILVALSLAVFSSLRQPP